MAEINLQLLEQPVDKVPRTAAGEPQAAPACALQEFAKSWRKRRLRGVVQQAASKMQVVGGPRA